MTNPFQNVRDGVKQELESTVLKLISYAAASFYFTSADGDRLSNGSAAA
ncbi:MULTISPECIES: hypothetical protein [Fischerella]|nr:MULTISPECIES: hypothetical protein [Fischerella]MBD2432152.1 hypothetical protein [Fischerella sp. FACHB-380]